MLQVLEVRALGPAQGARGWAPVTGYLLLGLEVPFVLEHVLFLGSGVL